MRPPSLPGALAALATAVVLGAVLPAGAQPDVPPEERASSEDGEDANPTNNTATGPADGTAGGDGLPADPDAPERVGLPTGEGTSTTIRTEVYREEDLSLRLWVATLWVRDTELSGVVDARNVLPDEVEPVELGDTLLVGESRLVLDWGLRRDEGLFARLDGAYYRTLVSPAPSVLGGQPAGGTWSSARDRYRLTDAHVGWRRGGLALRAGRSVQERVGFQVVDGLSASWTRGIATLSAFGGLSPHPWTGELDPRFLTAGGGAGWASPKLRVDLGAAAVLFEGGLDRLSLTHLGHWHPEVDGLAVTTLAVVDAATAVGVQLRHGSVSVDWAPVSRSRIGVTLSHLGGPLPSRWQGPVEAQLVAGRYQDADGLDADYLSNPALFATVARSQVRVYGVLGFSEALVLYGKATGQRRSLGVAQNLSRSLDDAPIEPSLVGERYGGGFTLGGRTFQRVAGVSVDASYTHLLGFTSTDHLGALVVSRDFETLGLLAEGGATLIWSRLLDPELAQGMALAPDERSRLRSQLHAQLGWWPVRAFGLSVLYQALVGELKPAHTVYVRIELRR